MVNLQHPGAYAVTYADVFFRDSFGTRQTRFNLAGLDNGIALVHALDGAGYDVFASLKEAIEHLLMLGIANFLKYGLLGRLCADAADILRLKMLFDIFAHFNRSEARLGGIKSYGTRSKRW